MAYFEGNNLVILETDNSEAIKEWKDWHWFLDPNHAGLIQQLIQRKKDLNLVLHVNVVGESENRLVRWLAHDGSANTTRLVLYKCFLGGLRSYGC